MKFIRMWLNDGQGPHGASLAGHGSLRQGGLVPPQKVTMLPGVIPSLSNDAEFFPLGKDWCYTFMVNTEEAPTGLLTEPSAGRASRTAVTGSIGRTA